MFSVSFLFGKESCHQNFTFYSVYILHSSKLCFSLIENIGDHLKCGIYLLEDTRYTTFYRNWMLYMHLDNPREELFSYQNVSLYGLLAKVRKLLILFLFYQWSNIFSNHRNQYLINYEFCVIIFFHSNSWIHFQIAMWINMTLCKKKHCFGSRFN